MTERDAGLIEWQLADLLLPGRGLTRSVPIELRRLPPVESVRIVEQYLVWKMKKPDRVSDGVAVYDAPWASTRDELDRRALSRSEKDMLRRFTELHRLSSQDILEYAKCWGPLRICQHNLPHCHPPTTGCATYGLRVPPPLDARLRRMLASETSRKVIPLCSVLNWEPLDTWRFFSRQARAIIDIAACIKTKRLGANEDWALVFEHGLPKRQRSTQSEELAFNRIFLVEAIRGWMSLGSFKPWLGELDGKISLSGADLFAKLSIEIALAASGCKGGYICSACGVQYNAQRKPPEGRENYCGKPECLREAERRRKARARLTQRRTRLPSGPKFIQLGRVD